MGCIYSNSNKVNPVDEDTYRKAENKIKHNQVKNSGIPKCSQDEAIILKQLREEGFLCGPQSTASGGVSIEITQVDSGRTPIRRPARLEKLEVQNKVKNTHEEIRDKLMRAEKRRKEREEQQKVKLHLKSKEKKEAVQKVHKLREEKEEEAEQRIVTVVENREKRLVEIRERMKARAIYREEVRRRKNLQREEDGP